jgi:hypothetical protein
MVSTLSAKKHVSIYGFRFSDLSCQLSTLQTFRISSTRTKLVLSSVQSIQHSLVVQFLALSWYDQVSGILKATILTHHLICRAASPWTGLEESALSR